MERRKRGDADRSGAHPSDRSVHTLKKELRREQREGRDDGAYADALRRVLRAFSNHDPNTALGLLSEEMRHLEQEEDIGCEQVDALRRALSLTDRRRRGSRALFQFYLRRMEAEGRGNEPFAIALKKALETPGRTSLGGQFDWMDESTD